MHINDGELALRVPAREIDEASKIVLLVDGGTNEAAFLAELTDLVGGVKSEVPGEHVGDCRAWDALAIASVEPEPVIGREGCEGCAQVRSRKIAPDRGDLRSLDGSAVRNQDGGDEDGGPGRPIPSPRSARPQPPFASFLRRVGGLRRRGEIIPPPSPPRGRALRHPPTPPSAWRAPRGRSAPAGGPPRGPSRRRPAGPVPGAPPARAGHGRRCGRGAW